jgi:hypothetical protein
MWVKRDNEAVEKSEYLYTVGENVKWCNNYGKQLSRFPKKLKVGLPCAATILLLGKYPKELKSGF